MKLGMDVLNGPGFLTEKEIFLLGFYLLLVVAVTVVFRHFVKDHR